MLLRSTWTALRFSHSTFQYHHNRTFKRTSAYLASSQSTLQKKLNISNSACAQDTQYLQDQFPVSSFEPTCHELELLFPLAPETMSQDKPTDVPERTVSAWSRRLIQGDSSRMFSPPTQDEQRIKVLWYLERLGVDTSLQQLPPIIHVAGTKGKGSTCAFCESVLRKNGFRTGLFTSPHLIDIRERFRLNGVPIAMDAFLDTFWKSIDGLQATLDAPNPHNFSPMPGYFTFMLILALQMFTKDVVDVLILEVGIGGKLDVTNVPTASVSGITQLDLDHTEILGDTIDLIAGEKAGILKTNIPGFTVAQEGPAMEVIMQKAATVGTEVAVVDPLPKSEPSVEKLQALVSQPTLDMAAGPWISAQHRLGLSGDFQRSNAAMALTLVDNLIARTPVLRTLRPDSPLSNALERGHPIGPKKLLEIPEVALGLEECRWAGRAQTFVQKGHGPNGGDIAYFLDGAHSPKSVKLCVDWFTGASNHAAAASGNPVERVLIFNCSHNRSAAAFLSEIARDGPHFSRAVFTVGASRPTHVKQPSVEEELKSIGVQVPSPSTELGSRLANLGSDHDGGATWLQKQAVIWDIVSQLKDSEKERQDGIAIPKVSSAVEYISKEVSDNNQESGEPKDVHVLVTGSLLLVGSVLDALGWTPADDGVVRI